MKTRLFVALMFTMALSFGCQPDGKSETENKPAAKKAEAKQPAAETVRPSTSREGGAASNDPTETEKPATVAEKPAAETEKPATVAEKPAEDTEKPAAKTDKPSTAREGGDASKPAVETDKPAAEAKEPSTAREGGDASKPAAKSGNPVVIIETSMGTFKVELYPAKTPITVANFLRYVDDEFYTGAIFHRVVRGFVIQAGGFDPDYGRRLTREPIINEAATGIPNERGTISMARTQQRNSASSQFYVSLRNNEMLNYRDETRSGWGYCAFGRVIEGMDVVDKIGEVETGSGGPFRQDVPKVPITLVSVRRAE
jgi:cyclophilin family peptidyl-prolyl cis-trans isomerase